MPGAAPVQMALLPKLDDGGFRAFVRFPKGWSRHDVGHYAVAEEFVVLEGTLALNADRWTTGGHAWLPPFYRRQDLASTSGCLVFAWFGGTPRWIAAEPVQPPSAKQHRSWIEGRRFERVTSTVRESLDLDDRTWRYGAASA